MRKLKKIVALLMTAAIALGTATTSFAASWQSDSIGWWWQNDDGTWPSNSWQWLDGNGDGVAECYYFDGNGYMLANTTTPDGYQVNADGAWVQNGVVQTQTATLTNNTGATANHNANYDPAHPLAGKIDEWNLRLPYNLIGPGYVYSKNVQAMLTGQMDQYFAEPVGYYTDAMGNTIHSTQEDYDRARASEQTMYNWFCNWLNGMDFENMSEMDRAKEIQKLLASAEYDYDYNGVGDPVYRILVEKKGICAEFAGTACTLAKALGLKSTTSGSGNHMTYYIQVDGAAYLGSNNSLDLNIPYYNVYCGY